MDFLGKSHQIICAPWDGLANLGAMCPRSDSTVGVTIDPQEWLVAFEMAMWLLECSADYLEKRIIADKFLVVGGLRKSMYLRWRDIVRMLTVLTPAEIRRRIKLQKPHLIDPDVPQHYADVAAMAGVNPRWVALMIDKGRLDAKDAAADGKNKYKHSLVRYEDLLNLMKETGRRSRYSDQAYFQQGIAALPTSMRQALST